MKQEYIAYYCVEDQKDCDKYGCRWIAHRTLETALNCKKTKNRIGIRKHVISTAFMSIELLNKGGYLVE